MKLEEIRALSVEELKKQLEESHKELLNLRFKASTRQLANHREIPYVKKTIARINTILRQKELGIQ